MVCMVIARRVDEVSALTFFFFREENRGLVVTVFGQVGEAEFGSVQPFVTDWDQVLELKRA